MRSMNDLFLHFIRDMYYAERHILKVLPKMARAAESSELREAFADHRAETQHHVERLQQVFDILGKRAQGVTCEAINGLIDECEELIEAMKEPSQVRDAGLIACGQAIEHYEMARYGALIAWAKQIGQAETAQILEKTLHEEKKAESFLGGLVNAKVKEMARATM